MHLIYTNFRSMNHVTVPLRTASLLWILLGLSSCMKEYTCGCTDFDNGPFYYTIEARSEEAARELCETPGGDCALQD